MGTFARAPRQRWSSPTHRFRPWLGHWRRLAHRYADTGHGAPFGLPRRSRRFRWRRLGRRWRGFVQTQIVRYHTQRSAFFSLSSSLSVVRFWNSSLFSVHRRLFIYCHKFRVPLIDFCSLAISLISASFVQRCYQAIDFTCRCNSIFTSLRIQLISYTIFSSRKFNESLARLYEKLVNFREWCRFNLSMETMATSSVNHICGRNCTFNSKWPTLRLITRLSVVGTSKRPIQSLISFSSWINHSPHVRWHKGVSALCALFTLSYGLLFEWPRTIFSLIDADIYQTKPLRWQSDVNSDRRAVNCTDLLHGSSFLAAASRVKTHSIFRLP